MRETGSEPSVAAAPSSTGETRKDPLADPAFRAPGFLERLREAFLGVQRPLDCLQVEVTSRCAGRCVYCPHTTEGAHFSKPVSVRSPISRELLN